MKIEPGIWTLFILGGITVLIAWQADKNRKSFNDSIRRFILLFIGVFLIISGILFIAKEVLGLSMLQNNFMNLDIWLWIFCILAGVAALAARQIDKRNRSFNAAFRRFALLTWGILSLILGFWFLVARLFG